MRTLTLLTLMTAALVAQTTEQIGPLGSWPMCESTAAADFPMCVGFEPGHEGYLMIITPDVGSGAVAYMYTATATLASTGQQVTLKGTVARAATTSVALMFGGPVTGPVKVVLEDLVSVAVVERSSVAR